MLGHVVLDEVPLDDPVELSVEAHRIHREAIQDRAPAGHHVVHPGLVLPLAVVAVRQVEELALQIHRGERSPVLEPHRLAAGQVAGDPPVGEHRAVEGEVAVDEVVLDHAEHDGHGAALEVVGDLAHVGVTHDDEPHADQIGRAHV